MSYPWSLSDRPGYRHNIPWQNAAGPVDKRGRPPYAYDEEIYDRLLADPDYYEIEDKVRQGRIHRRKLEDKWAPMKAEFAAAMAKGYTRMSYRPGQGWRTWTVQPPTWYKRTRRRTRRTKGRFYRNKKNRMWRYPLF